MSTKNCGTAPTLVNDLGRKKERKLNSLHASSFLHYASVLIRGRIRSECGVWEDKQIRQSKRKAQAARKKITRKRGTQKDRRLSKITS